VKSDGTGARHACEWSVKIWSKSSHVHDFLLQFIFAT
jgi:hypothetical protein